MAQGSMPNEPDASHRARNPSGVDVDSIWSTHRVARSSQLALRRNPLGGSLIGDQESARDERREPMSSSKNEVVNRPGS